MRFMFLLTLLLPILFTGVFAGEARANLCKSVRDTTVGSDAREDIDIYEEVFPDSSYHGNRRWNEIVVECNRKRDTKGGEILKALLKDDDEALKATLQRRNLDKKVIRGKYNFFGTVFTQLKYVYILGKEDGVWQMVLPYKAIMNEIVPNRVDFYVGHRNVDVDAGTVGPIDPDGHAWVLYDETQLVEDAAASPGASEFTLISDARPIAETQCSAPTFFPGTAKKYDGKNGVNVHKRDKANEFISLGQIQYRYKDHNFLREGCRVDKRRDLFWREDPSSDKVVRVKPQEWILDNFVRVAEDYWSRPDNFELKILLRGYNEHRFSRATLNLLEKDDHLTVRFATKFMPYNYNQMYKSNLIQFNNFSTMTTDGTYLHEVGHAFGLDDEYGGTRTDKEIVATVPKKNGCEHEQYDDFQPQSFYQMCDAGEEDVTTVYHYIAVSRYGTKQNECSADTDCGANAYCDKGTLTVGKNQCVALRARGKACTRAAQCATDRCAWGVCAAADECRADNDCAGNQFCGDPISGKRTCKALKARGQTCTNKNQCVTDRCAWGICAAADECRADGDCAGNQFCGDPVSGKRTCKALKARGQTCTNKNQCVTDRCAWGICAAADECRADGDCAGNQYCGDPISGKRSCKALKARGQACTKKSQCATNRCAWGICAAADECRADSDCTSSQYCGNPIGGKRSCKALKARGQACTKGSQCASGTCRISFTCK